MYSRTATSTTASTDSMMQQRWQGAEKTPNHQHRQKPGDRIPTGVPIDATKRMNNVTTKKNTIRAQRRLRRPRRPRPVIELIKRRCYGGSGRKSIGTQSRTSCNNQKQPKTTSRIKQLEKDQSFGNTEKLKDKTWRRRVQHRNGNNNAQKEAE